jgi:hypothetical protein
MITVSELKRWLDTLSPTDGVGVDEGGVTLVSYHEPQTYLEIGGYVFKGAEDDEV